MPAINALELLETAISSTKYPDSRFSLFGQPRKE
jgi:hypothetical protein